MAAGLGLPGRPREHALRDRASVPAGAAGPVRLEGELLMTWQTPTAVDFRFGFEITMYVAAR